MNNKECDNNWSTLELMEVNNPCKTEHATMMTENKL